MEFAAKAKAKLTERFKDPSTVQWRNTFVSGGAGLTLCGEVNAKNSYGGYIGFRRFFTNMDELFTGIENDGSPNFSGGDWEIYCSNRVLSVD